MSTNEDIKDMKPDPLDEYRKRLGMLSEWRESKSVQLAREVIEYAASLQKEIPPKTEEHWCPQCEHNA